MAHIEWQIPSPWSPAVQQGWQCPSCRRCYSPSMVMCSYCPAEPVTSTGTNVSPGCSCGTTIPCTWHPADSTVITTNHQGAVDFIAKGHLGTPCPRPRDGGLCGCDEDDDAPQDCLKMHCDH